MNKAVLAMGDSTRLVETLSKGLGARELFFSYGSVIPDLTPFETSYWMGGAYACKLRNVGLAANLCSPGASWLPSLDSELAGRVVHEGNISDLAGKTSKLWVKPSEAKISTIPAGLYTYDNLSRLFSDGNFSPEISLQWTEEVMDINYEHRFFVVEGEILTGSPYLVNKIGYHDGIDTSRMAEAQSFAKHVLSSDPVNMPPAFTLDIGLNVKTGKWFVIEANRAWSSGFYGCNPEAALEAVDYSCSQAITEKWQWKPDAHLVKLSLDWPKLQIVDHEEDSLEFFQFNKN